MTKPFFSGASATRTLKPAFTNNPSYLLLPLLALFLHAGFTPALAQDDPALKAQTQAYIELVYADEARDLEQWEKAKQDYATALASYLAIQQNHPDFNSEIISYRIAYCKNQIRAIERRFQQTKKSGAATSYDETKYQAALQENAYLRSRLDDLEEELENVESNEDLQSEVTRLTQELSQLKSGQNNAEAQLIRELEQAKQQTVNLRQEIDSQKNELANLKVIEAARQRDAQRIRDLSNEIRALQQANEKLAAAPQPDNQSDVAELESAVANEKNINRQLIQQLTAADKRIESLNDKMSRQENDISSFGEQISTLLKREQETSRTLSSLKKENAKLQSSLDDARKDASQPDPKLAKKLQALEGENEALSKRWESANKKIQELESETKALSQRNATLQKDVTKAADNKDVEKELADTRKALEASQKEVQTLVKDHQRELEEAVKSAQEETAALKKNLADSQDKLKQVTANNETPSSREKKLKQRVEELESSLKAVEKENDNFRKTQQKTEKEYASVQSALQQAAADLDAVKKREKELTAQVSAAEKNLQSAQPQLEKISAQLEEERQANAKALKERDEELQALTSRIAKVQAESEAVLEERDALKKSTKNHVAKSELDKALKEVKTLTRERDDALKSSAQLQQRMQEMERQFSSFQSENQKLKKQLESSLKTLDKVQSSVEKNIENQTAPLREEIDRLVQSVAELTSYKESVGGITGKELAELRKRPSSTPSPDTLVRRSSRPSAASLNQLLNQAMNAEREGNLPLAAELYSTITAQNDQYTPALKGLARIQLQTNRSKEAIPVLEQLLDIKRNDPEGLLLLGMAHYNLDDYRKAIGTLKKLVKRDEKNVQGWNALGAAFMAREDYRDARSAFEQAIATDPTFSNALYNLAQVIRLAYPKEKELAGEHYAQAIKLGNEPDPEMDAFLKRK